MDTKGLISFILCLTFLPACNQKVSFSKSAPSVNISEGVYNFPFQKQSINFEQDSYSENQINLTFQAIDKNGYAISSLSAADFVVTENGMPINFFDLARLKAYQGVDIVFVLDETESMDPIIQKVKNSISAFVTNLESKNLNSTLCLVTFKDTVTRICSGFVENNPNTTQNENSADFLNKISIINSQGGSDDPENQLDGVRQAILQTPWHSNNQKVIILVTNSNFHYQPNYAGAAGAAAPYYSDVLNLVQTNEVSVFTIGTSGTPGYDRSFQTLPALSDAVDGMFFDVYDIVSGFVSMNSIFNTIAEKLSTKYTLQYIVEQNNLDPTLSLANRNISIALKNLNLGFTIKVGTKISSYPEGHPELKTTWPLNSNMAINPSTFEVRVNGNLVSDYNISNNNIVFAKAPAEGANISISYELIGLKNNMKIVPVVIAEPTIGYAFEMLINGAKTKPEDYKATISSGKVTIVLQDSVFADADPYKIRSNGGLFVSFLLVPN